MNKNLQVIFLVTLTLFLSLTTISAQENPGLKILNDSSFEVDKTLGETNPTINFKLKNTLDKKLSNVSFEENEYITFPEIDELDPNQTAEIDAAITAEDPFDGKISIKGVYFQDIGIQNETYELLIESSDDISQTRFDTVVGDNLLIKNEDEDGMKYTLMNLETDNEITEIENGDNYTLDITKEGTANYALMYGGYTWHTFTINAEPQTGWINDPDYDAQIDLKININYPPTQISTTFPTTQYNMSFYETNDGIFTIKNEGDNKAKNINITGDWIIISENNFDLEPGTSKNIGYTIEPFKDERPVTNDTGKSYTKNITMEGNFETEVQGLDIFIERANVGDTGNISKEAGLIKWIEDFCGNNPSICQTEPEVVYKIINKSTVDVPFTEEQVKNTVKSIISIESKLDVLKNEYGKKIDMINTTTSTKLDSINDTLTKVLENTKETRDKYEEMRVAFIAVTTFLILFLIVSIVLYVVRRIKKRREAERTDSF